MIQYQDLIKTCEALGYPLVKSNGYPNLIGIRKSLDNDNLFNDTLYVLIWKNGEQSISSYSFPITTDPGRYYLLHPCNVKGCAIVKEGYYLNLWSFGMHNNKYPALVQTGKITVYRDNDRDAKFDFDKTNVDVGYFGINLHHAGVDSNTVDNWSAGCTVFKKLKDFDQVYQFCKTSSYARFNYTLLNESEIVKAL